MKRIIIAVLALAFITTLATASFAVTWTKLGTSSNQAKLAIVQDPQRFGLNDVVVDPSGNIWTTANGDITVNPQWGGDSNVGIIICYVNNGGSYTPVVYNCETNGFEGAVQQLEMDADGTVYGLQNWFEPRWSYIAHENRVLQFNLSGSTITATKVWETTDSKATVEDGDFIKGLAQGPDGDMYWIMAGSNGYTYWNSHFMWKFDRVGMTTSEAPINTLPTGNTTWGNNFKFTDALTYLGQDTTEVTSGIGAPYTTNYEWFGVFAKDSQGGTISAAQWNQWTDELGATHGRATMEKGNSDNDNNQEMLTCSAYDAKYLKAWYGPQSKKPSSSYAPSPCTMVRWEGYETNSCIVLGKNTIGGLKGIKQHNDWNVDGTDGSWVGVEWAPRFWVTALELNPNDDVSGAEGLGAWFGISGDEYYVDRMPLDHVWAWGGEDLPDGNYAPQLFDMGIPEEGATVVGVNFDANSGKAVALVLNLSTQKYSTYISSTAPSTGPAANSIANMKKTFPGAIVATDTAKVVTFADPLLGANGTYYIEDADRKAGIKCLPASGQGVPNVGDTVDVLEGRLAIEDSELTIADATATVVGSASIDPVGLVNRSVGGNEFGYQPETNPAYGLTNVGLLVTVWGRATGVDTGSGEAWISDDAQHPFVSWCTVDDGSGNETRYGSYSGPVTVPGIKVDFDMYSTSVSVGDYISVTGVVGLQSMAGNDQLLIRPRTASDIVVQ